MDKYYVGLDVPENGIASLVWIDDDDHWYGRFWLPRRAFPKFNPILQRRYYEWIAKGYVKLRQLYT